VHLLVCRHTGPGVRNIPRGPARCGSSARSGPAAPGVEKTERARLSYLLHWGSVPLARRAKRRTAGCERGCIPAQVATRFRERKSSLRCEYSECRCQRCWHRPHCACQQRDCAGESRLRGSRASLNSNCQKNRRKQSSPTARHVACNVVVNAFQQYERVAKLATAKFERRRAILELAHPPLLETSRIH
jgi:hypothetical protein